MSLNNNVNNIENIMNINTQIINIYSNIFFLWTKRVSATFSAFYKRDYKWQAGNRLTT